jgi:glycogen synthase
MRVLMLSWEYPPYVIGGLSQHVSNLVPALAEAGVEVHVVAPNPRNGLTEERIHANATIHRVATPHPGHDGNGLIATTKTNNSSLEQKARELHLRLGGFDLIHAHEWSVAYSAVAIKYATSLPLVATIHATERGRGQGHLASSEALAINGTEWWLTFEAWRVVTVSHFMADQLTQYFDVPRDKVEVIANGVAMPAYRRLDVAERRAFRNRFAREDERIVFFVGRIVYEKGLHLLIEAASRILAECGPTKFVIAGTGDQLNRLRQYVHQRGLHDRFFFTGFVPDADRDGLFQVADVAVFPSIYEPFGIVALEAMVHRCPVVVAATGGLKEVVRLFETGMTFHAGSSDSLAWAVGETLRYPERARARAEAALHEVEQHYQWSHIAAHTIAVYQRVISAWRQSTWAPTRVEQLA